MIAIGPNFTPDPIRRLIFATCGITIFTAFSETVFRQIFGWSGLFEYLSLSWQGLQHYYLWQLVTYMFVQSTYGYGISLFFLLSLAFNMYILWALGTQLLERLGTKAFLRFYFIIGVAAALLSLGVMALSGTNAILSGPLPSILAVLMVWTMLNPDIEVLLFFLIPLQAKWLMAGIIAAIVLITLSQLDFISLVFDLSGIVFGYLYAVIAWEFHGPFQFTAPLEKALKRSKPDQKGKIVDIKTGLPITENDDEQFVDAMLAKISKRGERSLSYKERRRMQEISATKAKKPK